MHSEEGATQAKHEASTSLIYTHRKRISTVAIFTLTDFLNIFTDMVASHTWLDAEALHKCDILDKFKLLCSDNNNMQLLASFFIDFGSQINTNGVLSFQSPFIQSGYMPQGFALSDVNNTLIVPFWDNLGLRRFGNVFYRTTSNAALLQRAHDQLQELFPSSANFTPTTLFIATWDRVAESRRSDIVSPNYSSSY